MKVSAVRGAVVVEFSRQFVAAFFFVCSPPTLLSSVPVCSGLLKLRRSLDWMPVTSSVFIYFMLYWLFENLFIASHTDRWWAHMRQFCFMTASRMVAKSQRWRKTCPQRHRLTYYHLAKKSKSLLCSCFKQCLQAPSPADALGTGIVDLCALAGFTFNTELHFASCGLSSGNR